MVMLIYIGKHRIKAIDKTVLGREVSGDNFAYLMLRVPNYTLAFIWPFYAKRAGLLKLRIDFDNKFKRPFMINLWLLIVGISAFLVAIVMNKFILT